jgi:cytosine/adenosine deaminase-related metal-dependent hydrolase
MSAAKKSARRPASAAAKPEPIDPLTSPRLALAGRVVTMDDAFTVHDDGVVYVEKGKIIAAQPRAQAAPPGFEATVVVDTQATLYPGLVELHNHLSYNALTLWHVPKQFTNRDQWGRIPEYRRLVSGPMTVVGKTPELLAPLVRYVECKCLLGGVTTSQGIALSSNAGIRSYYRGIVRNVEQTGDDDLPAASTRIADVDARDPRGFLEQLRREKTCFLLHLSEGQDQAAREHFLALRRLDDGTWALTDSLTGIHSAALEREDFDVLAEHGCSIVWSPFSNLLLYGGTADVAAARAAGVRLTLGPDWSPSGSKSLLGELKVARAWSDRNGGLFSDRELVRMATRNAAEALKWDAALGRLARGQRADLVAIAGTGGDAYEHLLRAKDTGVHLVMINGVARYGTPELMGLLFAEGEALRVGGESRRLFLEQETSDPRVQAVRFATARRKLGDALAELPRLARELEKPKPAKRRAFRALDAAEPVVWSLALDEIQDTGVELRPRLPFGAAKMATGPRRLSLRAAAKPLGDVLEPLELDAPTVADDPAFLERVAAERNLPPGFAAELAALY